MKDLSQQCKAIYLTEKDFTVARDSTMMQDSFPMLDIGKHIPDVLFDIRYSTQNNFTGKKLYPPLKTSYLRAPVVKALAKVQASLKPLGLGLKIWDAYRPYSVTCTMWDLIRDERYVALPSKGSGHNRGIAVDLTLVHLSDGSELDMGTPFDHFSDTAHIDFKDLPEEVLNNRLLLKRKMEANGFKILETEWWHFFWVAGKEFSVLDLDFKTLELQNRR